MNEAPRVFGPRIAKRKPAPKDTPKLAVELRGEKIPDVAGKDSEIAESNALRVAQVLKSILSRRKYGKGK